MSITGFINGVLSIILDGKLWLGLVIGYILGRKFYKPIEDYFNKSIENLKGGYKQDGKR